MISDEFLIDGLFALLGSSHHIYLRLCFTWSISCNGNVISNSEAVMLQKYNILRCLRRATSTHLRNVDSKAVAFELHLCILAENPYASLQNSAPNRVLVN
ncbi:hypothetical protein [Nostoc sp.]|uniref:hypothetical protein n=1 Tax=Nostoc sp. TaxID=1180 RepID=UPI002FFBF334